MRSGNMSATTLCVTVWLRNQKIGPFKGNCSHWSGKPGIQRKLSLCEDEPLEGEPSGEPIFFGCAGAQPSRNRKKTVVREHDPPKAEISVVREQTSGGRTSK